jgi:hypothetical protein
MGSLRWFCGVCAAALSLATAATGDLARAQSPAPGVGAQSPLPGLAAPSPASSSRSEQDAAIIRPLTEIGRVRARTPFCAALARARPGIDAAVAFEYVVPVVADDLRNYRFDSYLTRSRSEKKSEADLRLLWLIAQHGRAEVQALRDAAKAPGLDPKQKDEMLAFANALDGAKARQMWLAKQIARTLAVTEELPVQQMADQPGDDHASSALETLHQQNPGPAIGPTMPPAFTQTDSEYVFHIRQEQRVFDTFGGEEPIRADLKTASEHGALAMQLGGCSSP